MKKTILILLAISLIACFTACGSDTEESATGLPNPMAESTSLSDMNKAASTNIGLPADMEVKNETFTTIETGDGIIAQYCFKYEDSDFTMRSSSSIKDADISGIYINAEPAFTGEVQSNIEINCDENIYVARWANEKGQFSLSTSTAAINTADFTDLVMKLSN